MKDPAFLFYSNDFLSGTMLMTDEEVGQYIKLICLQHQKGHLREKDMLNICKTYNEDIFSKFKKDQDGNYYNERLEEEIIRRIKYSESRRNNRKKKDLEEQKNETYVEDMNNHMIKDMKNICNSYEEHMETETENENINENIIITENKNEIYNNIIYIYNTYCINLPKIQKITQKRKSAINKFLKEFTIDDFEQICALANNNAFLTGDNDRNWKADFDFIIRPDKAVSILEGKYNFKKKDKMDGFKDLMEEARLKDEQTGNNTNNNTFGW